jgi:hypothetical protein
MERTLGERADALPDVIQPFLFQSKEKAVVVIL